MLGPLGVILLCLGLAPLAAAQPPVEQKRQLQALVDQATQIGVTRPAEEVLVFLDSLRPQLAGASSEQMAQLGLVRARAHGLITEYDTAFAIIEDLLAGDLTPQHRLRSYELAANLALHIDRYEMGFEYLNRGIALQAQVDDPALKSGIFGLAAYWHSQLGDREKGLDYAHRTMALARVTGESRELCVAFEKLGQAEELNGLLEQALARYQAGLRACEEAGDPVFYGIMHGLIGRVLFALKRYEEAETLLQQGIALTAESGFEDGATDSMRRYGELLLEQGRNDEAEAIFLSILERTRHGGRPNNRADAQRWLAQINLQKQDYRRASEYLIAYLASREKVFDIERARSIAFQEVEFDMQTQAQEISLLREQARVSELQDNAMQQQRQFQQIVIIMAVSILALLLLLLIRSLRDRRHLRHLSAHDGLTRMLNHTHFFDTAKSEIQKAMSMGQPLTLVLADIDHFKRFNDHHGHQAGDEVLRKAASRFKATLSPFGVIGRVGGEEFAACLPGLDIHQAALQVAQVRGALLNCRLSDIEDTVTMSFGLAQIQASDSFDSLRARADAALYQAKHKGRDRMILADIAETERT